MGWGAADVACASLWQYQAAFDGWRAGNKSDDAADGLTDAEFAELGELLPTMH